MDQMVRYYTCKRMTKRWPMVVFFNLIDISALNAYIVWCHLNPECNTHKKNRRRKFLIALGKELAQIDAHVVGVEEMMPDEPAKKKARCHICPNKRDRKSKTVCKICQCNMCTEHSIVLCQSCFTQQRK